jgi:hypothetical protein
MLTAGLSIKNVCDFPLSLILLICSSAPFSFSSSSLLSIQEKHWLLTGQNKTTARAPTSVIHDAKYCTIIIQHALHKATAKLTRNSRAPRHAPRLYSFFKRMLLWLLIQPFWLWIQNPVPCIEMLPSQSLKSHEEDTSIYKRYGALLQFILKQYTAVGFKHYKPSPASPPTKCIRQWMQLVTR